MRLEEYGQTLAYDVAFWMQGLANPDYPIDQLGTLSVEVSTKFRALAILTLLVKGEPDFFFHNLIRSGKSREAYLRRLREAGLTREHHQASGRYEPLLDVIASGDWELARSIVSLSPSEFFSDHEWEDDYCYAQILHRFVAGAPLEQEMEMLFARLRRYLEREPSPRLDISRALVRKDQDAFDEAFDQLIEERGKQIEEDKENGQLEEPEIMAQRQIFVEGLAILRLAELQGLSTQDEYRYCPSLARVPMRSTFPGE